MRKIKIPLFGFISASIVLCLGCEGSGQLYSSANDLVRPTIAVLKFENRAPFAVNWNIGDGMADVLVDRLVATRRYQVVERAELGAVVGEIQLQQSGVTRPQSRAEAGRLKNVRYLIKGTVTDFGHVSSSGGFLGVGGWSILGGGNKAIIGMTLYVIDVESGQILCSESIQESVNAKDLSVKATYQNVSFGGKTFYQTPLGKATARVLDKAVGRVSGVIAAQPWQPKVAMVGAQDVVISGGKDRGLGIGDIYEIIQTGQPILDPDSGDVIGNQSNRVVAKATVNVVEPMCSRAILVVGNISDVKLGQHCRLVQKGK